MKLFSLNSTVLLILFFCLNTVAAQSYVGIFNLNTNEKDSVIVKVFNDSLACTNFAQKLKLLMLKKDFISLRVDTLISKKDTSIYNIFLTKYFKNVIISRTISTGIEEKMSFYPKENSSYSLSEFIKLQEKIIGYWENNGFPFCSVQLVNTSVEEYSLKGDLEIKKNIPVKLDSINISGTLKLNKYFIYNFAGIKPGAIYNENKIINAGNRLRELSFATLEKSPQLIFTRKYTKLNLFLNQKKANQFDGILGFLPDNQTGKILFTGQAHIRLFNSFSAGEFIEADWRKLQVGTQDLKINFNYPYIFRTPIGFDYGFNLYKRDTTFTDLKNTIGLQFLLSGANYFKVFYSIRSSNLISTQGLEFLTVLPDYADITTKSYGIGIKLDYTNYRFNPRKGLRVTSNFSVGNKNIRKNPNVNPLAYQNVQLKSVQYLGDGFIDYFIPILKKGTLLIGAKSAYISGQSIFSNELFRIGGLQSFRGFDDESIFASFYAISNIEYRFLMDKNSNIFLFASRAYLENISANKRIIDRPLSFGAGISFETKAGIFNLTYALGKQLNNPIILRAAKIHFGIVSLF
ncbi:MAG: POTRA domain-containing protein [Bacteroidota bacterium]